MEKNDSDETASFSSGGEKLPEPDRLSAPPDHEDAKDRSINDNKVEEYRKEKNKSNEADLGSNFHNFFQEIDQFADAISNAKNNRDPDGNPPNVPSSVEKFEAILEGEITKFDSCKDHGVKWSRDFNEDSAKLLEGIGKVSMLNNALGSCMLNPKYKSLINRTGNLMQQAMVFLEEEFRSLMEDCLGSVGDSCAVVAASDLKKKRQSSFKSTSMEMADRCIIQESDSGYETECCQAYSIVRRHWFEDSLVKAGFEKISIEDVQKMNWEPLEGEIATWIKASKLCITSYFSGEKKLSEAVFSDHPSISRSLFGNLARGIVIQLLNFAEAVAMTKRSAERLFKFLDVHETLRDLIESMDRLFQGWESSPELKSETASTCCHVGEAAVSIFSDLENSIKADSGKTPVPGGAVHPLTRYVMNYVKYACEYKDTLELVFQENQNSEYSHTIHRSDNQMETNHNRAEEKHPSPFAVKLMMVMDLLDSNLESKSKLYKDPSLSYIFLMNNGRYIMQKVKGSAEILNLLGDTWRRKRSSDLRQYHKNYQRETWSKVLGCLKDEGLQQGKGSIVKPLLKERFKSFNSMIDDIRKTQSLWVVCDEQLQSELRVSITAVVIPAYRSFLGRFQQYLSPGRQTQKDGEEAGNICRQLVLKSNGEHLLSRHRLKEATTLSGAPPPSFIPETPSGSVEKEQSTHVAYMQRGPSFSDNSQHIEEDQRKTAAAAVAAKLQASTSSAQMLSFVLSSLSSGRL
ncbi:Exocyst complex protein Exo70 [Cinnamomum micranthum f. kanehirae]|uniref:Exocyst subunit Exo70 family protein n=1 Tax=Cinnamomum micranthum f. kanehirae TaxID=337451 RepID=A0A443NNJ8_9MAGN|nr:Exocyst complex protein Exo70 [Cinnamomum micranthum f. kanehirae]